MISSALLYALDRLLSPEDTSLSDIAVSPHLTARLVSAPATEDDGQADGNDAQPEGRDGSPLASAPALASLEDEIGSLNSRIRKPRDYCWRLGSILSKSASKNRADRDTHRLRALQAPDDPGQGLQGLPARAAAGRRDASADLRRPPQSIRRPDPGPARERFRPGRARRLDLDRSAAGLVSEVPRALARPAGCV